jgi:mono/diheme cytochrome c family protein
LTFAREGKVVETLPIAALAQRDTERTLETRDPYYQAQKRFRGVPLAPVLAAAYGVKEAALRDAAFVLRAKDGYAVTLAGRRIVDDGAFLAFDDVDAPGFAPVGPRKVSPAPAYLAWPNGAGGDLETHPRPWQLERIDWVDPAALYPHARPSGVADDSAAMRGFRLFRERCIRCHAINREGGSVGPELNVPQSIVNYWPVAQIRAYVRNPLTFRYGAMPPNPDLSDAQLDALIAYFETMAKQPFDPERRVP